MNLKEMWFMKILGKFLKLNLSLLWKKKSRLNRKMGHVTIVNKDINEAKKSAKSKKIN